MQPSLARKLGLHICNTNVDAQKIDGSISEIFGIVIALFQIDHKDKKPCLFEETFPMANMSMDIALKCFFLLQAMSRSTSTTGSSDRGRIPPPRFFLLPCRWS